MVFLLLAGAGGGAWLSQFRVTMRALLEFAFQGELRPEGLVHVLYQVFWHNLVPLLLGGLAVVVATLGLRLMTTRFGPLRVAARLYAAARLCGRAKRSFFRAHEILSYFDRSASQALNRPLQFACTSLAKTRRHFWPIVTWERSRPVLFAPVLITRRALFSWPAFLL